jgi:hypothetical protein
MFHINKPKFGSIFLFVFVGVFIVALVASSVVPAFAQPLAGAATPRVLWQLPGAYGGPFTADGSAVYLVTGTGFQLRRAADGALLSAITLPASSLGYDASAFSADMQYVALSIRANGITRIELWRVSDGTLARTINTDAVRNARGLDLSLDSGLVAIMERFAYGGGGMLRVYRTSDGALVHKEGPLVQMATPA